MPSSKTSARLDALAAAFTELGPAWGRWVTVCTPSESVSYIRLRLLRALRQDGSQTMTQVACALNLTQRRITALVVALVDEQLVVRAPNPSDGRSTVITITTLGEEHLQANWARFEHEVGDGFSDLTAEQQQALLDITPALTDSLRKRVVQRATIATADDI